VDANEPDSGCAADSGSPPPSCASGAPGTANCGECSESCCTSLEVSPGTYFRTYTNSGSGPTGETDPANVSAFRLDKYLVTVGRFRAFVGAWTGGWLPAPGSGVHSYLNGGLGLTSVSDDAGSGHETGWVTADNGNIGPTSTNLGSCAPYSSWTTMASTQENLPINCVNWWEAYAFCIWDGGFLPSDTEGEYAAAGGTQQREYPWGSTAPGESNQYAIYGSDSSTCHYPAGALAACTGVANIAPVGTATLGAGLWGQLDLAGESFEWDLDWYAPFVDPCTDCAYLAATSGRVLRGGDFLYGTPYMLPPYRYGSPPNGRFVDVGFRCARVP
jgi:formylglycine-generating enzyme required for sulfatase activity